jgi:flagella basal body P-ring formation protein FlgA
MTLGLSAIRLLLAAALCGGSIAAHAQQGVVVLVPTRVIYPGETIDMNGLKEVVLKAGKEVPPAMATTVEELDGKVARRTLLPGRYVPVASLREVWLVEQGAAVQAVYSAGGLTISAAAVTLQPGSAGDLVRVRNIDSGKVLSGTVMANGTIRVGAP